MPLLAPVSSTRWIVTLALLTATTALSIDMSLPAQPTLTRELETLPSVTQLTLSLFLVGFALGQLGVGPLSDALGRRRVLLAGLAVFALAGLVCGLAPSIGVLVAMRFLQGAAASVGPVIGRAMVRDTHGPADSARVLASMTAVLAAAPMVAPIVGGLLLTGWGWRAIFGALGTCGLVMLGLSAITLSETHPPARRRSGSPRAIAEGFRTFFRTPGTVPPALLLAASFAGQFAFVSASPFVLMEHYRVAPAQYGLYFGATALALMAGATLGSRLLRRGTTSVQLLTVGAALMCGGGLALVAGVRSPLGVAAFLTPLLAVYLGIGLVAPNATAKALEPVPAIVGTASSVIGFLPMVAGALSGWLVTAVGGSDPRPLSWVLVTTGLVAAALVVRIRQNDRRLVRV